VSYSLYMTHLVWFGVCRAAMNVLGIEDGVLYAVGWALAIAGAFVVAWLMWRIVEEPCRRFMRKAVGVRPVAPEESTVDPDAKSDAAATDR